MQYVNNITQGLGNKILHDINEDNAFTRGLKSVGNAALSALGSNSARGRLKHQKATSYLIGKWKEYTAIGNKPWTYNTLYNFLAKTFNPNVAAHLRDVLFTVPDQSIKPQDASTQSISNTANQTTNQNSAGSMSSGSPTNPNTKPTGNIDVTGQGTASFNTAAQPTTTSNMASNPTSASAPQQPQQNDLRTLNAELAKADPSKIEVMQLVYNLLKASRSNISPNRKEDIIANLKNIQRKFAYKVPQLNQIPTVESRQRIFDFTEYLIEHRITSRYDINETYNAFLTERPFGSSITRGGMPATPAGTTAGSITRQKPQQSQRQAFGQNIVKGGTPAAAAGTTAGSVTKSPTAPTSGGVSAGNTTTTATMPAPTQATITGTPTAAQAAPAKPAKPRVLSSNEINNFFEKIAVVMLDNGGMSVDDPQWTKKAKGLLGRVSGGDGHSGGHDDHRGYQNQPSHSHSTLDLNALDSEFRALKYHHPRDEEMTKAIARVNRITTLDRRISIDDLIKMLSKEGVNNNLVISAIYKSQR